MALVRCIRFNTLQYVATHWNLLHFVGMIRCLRWVSLHTFYIMTTQNSGGFEDQEGQGADVEVYEPAFLMGDVGPEALPDDDVPRLVEVLVHGLLDSAGDVSLQAVLLHGLLRHLEHHLGHRVLHIRSLHHSCTTNRGTGGVW